MGLGEMLTRTPLPLIFWGGVISGRRNPVHGGHTTLPPQEPQLGPGLGRGLLTTLGMGARGPS